MTPEIPEDLKREAEEYARPYLGAAAVVEAYIHATLSERARQSEAMEEPQCDAGCMTFTGGDKRHTKTCPFYPESVTKMLDDAQAERDAAIRERDEARHKLETTAGTLAHAEKALKDLDKAWAFKLTTMETMHQAQLTEARAELQRERERGEKMRQQLELGAKCLKYQAQDLAAAIKEIDEDPFENWDSGHDTLRDIRERLCVAASNASAAIQASKEQGGNL